MDAALPTDPLHLELAPRLPEPIRFGTSSWNYPGWQGLIYHRPYKNEKELTARSLEEYGQFPWFRTVGIDHSFYSPPKSALLMQYAAQLPPHFEWVSKVWEEITIARYPKLARYGTKAGQPNPRFLDAEQFVERVLFQYGEPEVARRTGPFVFQFASFHLEGDTNRAQELLTRFDEFLSQLPDDFRYAFEVRDPELLCPRYFEILNAHGATHCFNHWTSMPPLIDQMKASAAAGGLTAPFYVARILTPLTVSYENAVAKFSPYQEIRLLNPQMRQDVVRLAKRALERNVRVYILVNNRSEGCAPRTVAEIGKLIVDELHG